MSRLTSYWENYDRFYDDFQKEGLNLDDLLFKTKLNFYDGKLSFSSKTKFNFNSVATAAHEITLKHKNSKGTVELKEKVGEITLEAEHNHWSKDNLSVGSFVKAVVNQSKSGCKSDAKVQLRVHHKDNILVTLGAENWNACKGLPKDFVIGTSFGQTTEGSKLAFNTLFNFNVETSYLQLVKFFAKAQKGDVTGVFLANLRRSQSDDDKKDSTNSIDISALFTKELDSTTKLGGFIGHDIDSKKTDAEVVLSKKFDKLRLNAKVTSKRSAIIGVTSVHDDITFNVAAKSTLQCKSEKDRDVESQRHWIDFKFGASVEFNRL
jgi:hypothetical protein